MATSTLSRFITRTSRCKGAITTSHRIGGCVNSTRFNSTASTVDAMVIDGKAIAAEIRNEIRKHTHELKDSVGVVPGLAVVLVGSRKDSETYVRNKKKAANDVGFRSVDITLAEDATEAEVLESITKLNQDPSIHAILVQLPLPKHINEANVLEAITIDKDVDGFSVENIGKLCMKGGRPPTAIPCTPAGCIELLKRSNVPLSGKDIVVLGRSNIVGMPVAALLQSLDATVTVCHSRTKDLEEKIRKADVVVAAIGRAQMVRGEWLKPGCVVIDVGINAVTDESRKLGYRIVGDVNFDEAKRVASQVTPVPGGVGPMTIAMLLKNTLQLARMQNGLVQVE